ncbi:MAG: class I SAM-dependent methyltransferase [Planctomycetes bacterium]|nr:class I SAM-dependent methyltransferase [Planctomycetota bacterium]
MSGARSQPALTRHELYELCVTNASAMARFVHAVHGQSPRVLREDFCGSAALARAWAGAYGPAIGVDRDGEPLRACATAARLRLVESDVMRAKDRADIIAATNFPLGYWYTRQGLIAYLKHARACLKRRGVFVADMYGGADAFVCSRTVQRLRGPNGEKVEYEWEQREANAATGRVRCAIHFRVTARGRKVAVLRDAFEYDWRLWGIPELKDAYLEAGFRSVEVHDRLGGAVDHTGALHVRPLDDDEALDENYVVYVVGRV